MTHYYPVTVEKNLTQILKKNFTSFELRKET